MVVGVRENEELSSEIRAPTQPRTGRLDDRRYLWQNVLVTVVRGGPCPAVRVDDSSQRFVREQAEMFRAGHFRQSHQTTNGKPAADGPNVAGRNDDATVTGKTGRTNADCAPTTTGFSDRKI